MSKGTKTVTLFMTIAALAASSTAFALISPDELKAKAEKAVEQFRAENPQATELLDAAAGILVCPKIREVGLIFGLERGAFDWSDRGDLPLQGPFDYALFT